MQPPFSFKGPSHKIFCSSFFLNQFILVLLEMFKGCFNYFHSFIELLDFKNDSPVLRKPASCFTVCVNLQAHANAFKATLSQKTV